MPTVLVVDDDRLLLAMATDCLMSAGFEVMTATTPEAVLAIDLSKVAAIICDYNMPGMNGDDLLVLIRKACNCQAPFIFLTAHGKLDDLLPMAIRYQAELLPKPFEPAALLELLHRQLANSTRRAPP